MELTSMFDFMVEQSKANIPTSESDYISEDGLLYCGKCKTKKQTEVTFLGITKRPFCVCKCEAERRAAEEQRLLLEKRIEELKERGFINSEMLTKTFANDDMSNPKITRAMQNYVENFPQLRKEGKGLLLYGNVGTGKTYAACEVANELINRGYPVKVTNFAEIINDLQATFEKQEYIERLNDNALLVIDDLGIERDTAFAKEQVYNVIDSRYRAGLPMIITTNLTIDKIKNINEIEYKRIYERILEKCHPIEVTGENRRRKAIREGYNDMQDLLGL